MILGIFLAVGDSFSNMAKVGQDVLFKQSYLKEFAKEFSKIYIFSYEDEKVIGLPNNIEVIPNKYKFHRYIYGVLLPILNFRVIIQCTFIRAYHLSGTIPAIITRLFFSKPFTFNYAYDYWQFAKIDNKFLQAILFSILKQWAFLFSSRIFAANKTILQEINTKKTIYLPNGVDINTFKPLNNKKTNNKILLLSVGRLEKQKNYINLIKALRGIDIDLLIIGRGSLKQKILDVAKKEKVSLRIIDKVKNSDMPKIYNEADLFILPSLAEGHPKVLLEACACGLPVIATRIKGVVDIIRNKKNGILIQQNNYSIARAIKLLMSDKKLANRLSKNAQALMEAKFNLKHLIKKEIQTIKSMVQLT